MPQKKVEEIINDLERYATSLKRLLEVLEDKDKASSASFLMLDITNQDIGMICWQIPKDWRSEFSIYSPRIESRLREISQIAAILQERAKGKEDGLPALDIFSYHISNSVSRVLKECSSAAPHETTSNKQSLFRRLFGAWTWTNNLK